MQTITIWDFYSGITNLTSQISKLMIYIVTGTKQEADQ